MAISGIGTVGLPFPELRESGGYYVDKTLLIADLLDLDDCGIYVNVRPRGFGRTMNVSMLDAFFNSEYRGNPWFDGLAVSERRDFDRYRNAFPVILLDLQHMSAATFDSFLDEMRRRILGVYMRHAGVFDGEVRPPGRLFLEGLESGDLLENRLSFTLLDLCDLIRRRHGVRPVVLIDGYDDVLADVADPALEERIIGFLDDLMLATLKGNNNLQMAFVTGFMRPARVGFLPAFNNYDLDSPVFTMTDGRFGFTEDEARSLLEHHGRPELLDEVMEWYGGYRFGKAELCNPYAVTAYVSGGFATGSHWAEAGGVGLPVWALGHMDSEGLAIAASLMGGHRETVRLYDGIAHGEVRPSGASNLFMLAVLTGYCRAEPAGGEYTISIPSRDMRGFIESMLDRAVDIPGRLVERFAEAVAEGDADSVSSAFAGILDGAACYGAPEGRRPFGLMVLATLRRLAHLYGIGPRPPGNPQRIVMVPRSEGAVPVLIGATASGDGLLEWMLDGTMRDIRGDGRLDGMGGRVVLIGLAFSREKAMCRTEILYLP